MSHEIKDDLPATSPTPKANKVAQSTGHAYMSELAIAQDDLLSLSHRLQSDSHIEHTWYTKLNLHVLPSTSTTSDTFDASTPKLYHMSNTSTSIPTMDKADVICLQPVSPADTLPNPRCEANCESYSSLLEVTANSLKDKANSEGNCTDVSSSEGCVDVRSQEVRINHVLAIQCVFCTKLFEHPIRTQYRCH